MCFILNFFRIFPVSEHIKNNDFTLAKGFTAPFLSWVFCPRLLCSSDLLRKWWGKKYYQLSSKTGCEIAHPIGQCCLNHATLQVTYPTSCDAPPGVRCVSSNRCSSSSPGQKIPSFKVKWRTVLHSISGCPDNEPSLGRRCAVPSSVTCSYGSECCCGKCYSSFEVQCRGGEWNGYYTDACRRPDCPSSGELLNTD